MTDRSAASPQELEAAACLAAREAGLVLRARFRDGSRRAVETKGLHDFVTEVDRQAEEAVVRCLRARHPDHTIMAEEGSPDAGRSAVRWIVDPLDGTTNFIHGVMPFAVSVAVEDDAGLIAGAIHDPIHDETFHAHRGGGAFLNEVPIHCSRLEAPSAALVATGFPFRELGRLDAYLRAAEAVIRCTAGLRRAGSASIDLAYTACGRYDGFFELGLSRWDIAAGIVIVREAGGIVTDWHGDDRALETGDVVAAGRVLHQVLVDRTHRALAGTV